MLHTFSRRAFSRGVTWAAPVAVITTTAPAVAASLDPQVSAVIDDAFAQADAALRNPDGTRRRLEINFYQPAAGLDGTAVSVYVNVKNLEEHTFDASPSSPLVFFVDSVRIDANGGNRGYNPRAEWEGELTYLLPESDPRRNGVDDVAQGGVEQTFRWSLEKSIAPNGERDMAIGFRSALSSGRRNKLVVRPPLLAPALDSIVLPSGSCSDGCAAYYARKLAEWKTSGPVQWMARGTLSGAHEIAAGEPVDSSVIGNHSSGTGSQSLNGIW